ncbi:hypothetical protein [Streptomyces sp. NPDC002276]
MTEAGASAHVLGATVGDRALRLWNTVTGRQVAVLQDTGTQSASFSPDGGTVFAGRGRGLREDGEPGADAGAVADVRAGRAVPPYLPKSPIRTSPRGHGSFALLHLVVTGGW